MRLVSMAYGTCRTYLGPFSGPTRPTRPNPASPANPPTPPTPLTPPIPNNQNYPYSSAAP